MNKIIKAVIGIPISITIATSASSANAFDLTYATKVESYTQGDFRYDDQNKINERTNTDNALYAPQPYHQNKDFLSLGLGGEVVFSFGGLFSGPITVWETTWGNHTQSSYDEQIDVYVGNDLENWFEVGEILNIEDDAYQNGATINIGNDNLYKYLRLVDKSQDTGGRDGFDVNAVAVHIPASVPEPTSTLGLLGVSALASSLLRKTK
ncbi:MAG: PEP-CTERM sorting domain-containing protein [Trichodesmium sp.]